MPNTFSPILMTGVTPAGMGRVPLHTEDARRFADKHLEALQLQQNTFDQKMERLRAVADAKRAVERRMRPGPVDQERSLRQANEMADGAGVSDPSTLPADFLAYMTSRPETRNALLHSALIPENAILQVSEALSGQKPAGEIASRLARSVPGAFYPPAGYAVEPARDRMYERLGPAAGLAVDYLMPGPAEAIGGLSSVVRAADKGLRSIPMRADLVDDAGDVIRRLRAEAQ